MGDFMRMGAPTIWLFFCHILGLSTKKTLASLKTPRYGGFQPEDRNLDAAGRLLGLFEKTKKIWPKVPKAVKTSHDEEHEAYSLRVHCSSRILKHWQTQKQSHSNSIASIFFFFSLFFYFIFSNNNLFDVFVLYFHFLINTSLSFWTQNFMCFFDHKFGLLPHKKKKLRKNLQKEAHNSLISNYVQIEYFHTNQHTAPNYIIKKMQKILPLLFYVSFSFLLLTFPSCYSFQVENGHQNNLTLLYSSFFFVKFSGQKTKTRPRVMRTRYGTRKPRSVNCLARSNGAFIDVSSAMRRFVNFDSKWNFNFFFFKHFSFFRFQKVKTNILLVCNLLLSQGHRENEYMSFAQVLKHSLSVEKTTPAFCEICKKFTPTNQYARVSMLRSVFMSF